MMWKVFKLLVFVGFLSIVSCRPEPFYTDTSMILESYNLALFEPSGLSYSADKKSFYLVSDRGIVYKTSLTGEIIEELSYLGDDLEAITVNSSTSEIFICEESQGNLLKISNKGVVQNTYNILNAPGNTGLEGLCYNNALNEFYMLKEKSEGLLIKYSIETGDKTDIALDFAFDYSGIYFNNITNNLWIVSDESKTLTKCDLDGNLIESFSIPISGMEGIVVNDDETEAYIVSDPNNKMYKISLTYKEIK